MIVEYTPDLGSEMLRLGLSMKNEGMFKNRSWNENKLLSLFSSPNVFCVLYKKDGIGFVGFFLGCLSVQYFGDDVIATDLAFYILPEFRASFAAIRMVRKFEEWAELHGAKEVYLGQSTGIDIGRTGSFIEKLGYTHIGCLSKKEI